MDPHVYRRITSARDFIPGQGHVETQAPSLRKEAKVQASEKNGRSESAEELCHNEARSIDWPNPGKCTFCGDMQRTPILVSLYVSVARSLQLRQGVAIRRHDIRAIACDRPRVRVGARRERPQLCCTFPR
jgi:hypothetical protein